MNLEDVTYFALPPAPGDYFTCARYGTMSTESCSRNYKAAPSVFREGRLAGCMGCAVGALHSKSQQEPSRLSPMACARCRRGPDQYNKGYGRMRLVRGKTICVSCFNREREFFLGRNAKGTKPTCDPLLPMTVAVVVDGRMQVTRIGASKDRIEAAITAMRRVGLAAMVSWVGGGVADAVTP